jgi:hypothetical protein
VPPSRIKSILWSRFTLSLLGLAFCVFAWGLQYKLSLYDPPQAISHEMPHAKLLSKDQQSHADESPLLRVEVGSDKAATVWLSIGLFALILALDPPFCLDQSGRYSAKNEPVRSPSHANLNAFFFRPPPALY